mmetsp:Transcript_30897/g.77581  ORF Transcript_30897/g.77581 Transcript_30897/m.77581 type:complete len:301 (+) Transcript_30897:85-987(+)
MPPCSSCTPHWKAGACFNITIALYTLAFAVAFVAFMVSVVAIYDSRLAVEDQAGFKVVVPPAPRVLAPASRLGDVGRLEGMFFYYEVVQGDARSPPGWKLPAHPRDVPAVSMVCNTTAFRTVRWTLVFDDETKGGWLVSAWLHLKRVFRYGRWRDLEDIVISVPSFDDPLDPAVCNATAQQAIPPCDCFQLFFDGTYEADPRPDFFDGATHSSARVQGRWSVGAQPAVYIATWNHLFRHEPVVEEEHVDLVAAHAPVVAYMSRTRVEALNAAWWGLSYSESALNARLEPTGREDVCCRGG